MRSATKLLFSILLCCAFESGAQVSVALKDITGPPYPVFFAGIPVNLGYLVQNTGTVVITSIDCGYVTPPNAPVNHTWNGSLAPNDTVTIFIPGTFTSPFNFYNFRGGIGFANSQFIGDSVTVLWRGPSITHSIPFTDDFEGTGYWADVTYRTNEPVRQISHHDAETSWELGTPNYGSTIGAFSGSNSQDIRLNSQPDSSAASYLYSPYFDLTTTANPTLMFMQNRNTTSVHNGLHIEYTNDTLTWNQWHVLTDFTGFNSVNWYNDTGLLSSGLPAWAGNSGGWIRSARNLAFLNGSTMVQFRFVYSTDSSGLIDDGVSIDDFSIVECSLIATPATTMVTCFGNNDGAITIAAAGGTPPYSYLWSNGNTTATATNLPAGFYSITVTDVNGCFAHTSISITQPPLLTLTVSGSSVPCGATTGTITPIPVGGTPPYTYFWSNGTTLFTLGNVGPGSYVLTVTDINGCTAQAAGTIMASNGPMAYVDSILPPSCNGGADGGIYLRITNGNAPYVYIWSNGNTSDDNTNLSAGAYTIVITDANNCTNTFSYTLVEQLPEPGLAIVNYPTDCSTNDGVIAVYPSGGVPPYSYQWNNGSASQILTNLMTGIYSCIITDAMGCTVTAGANLTTPAFSASAVSTPAGCSQSNGSITVTLSNGSTTCIYSWSNGMTVQSPSGLDAGLYTVYIQDTNSCFTYLKITVDDTCHGVWPGDANFDLTVDNTDLLNIGIGYGATGPVRPGASLNWFAQLCPSWLNTFASGINYKNADCNGDGVIDDNDTTAILVNYGLNHPFIKPVPPPILPGIPDLYLVVSTDTTGLSDTISIEVFLGTVGVPVDSVYGIAFTIDTDPSLTDSTYANANFGNCWMGTQGTDLLTLTKNRMNSGSIDVALVRTDHANVSGSGPLGVISLVTTDNIAGKPAPGSTAKTLTFSISKTSAITAAETYLQVNQLPDSIVIDSAYIAGVTEPKTEKDKFFIAPNPSSDLAVLFCKTVFPENAVIEISDVNGRLLYSKEAFISTGKISINTRLLENGLYVVTINKGNSVQHIKLLIQH